jgi:hypothetical protein
MQEYNSNNNDGNSNDGNNNDGNNNDGNNNENDKFKTPKQTSRRLQPKTPFKGMNTRDNF